MRCSVTSRIAAVFRSLVKCDVPSIAWCSMWMWCSTGLLRCSARTEQRCMSSLLNISALDSVNARQLYRPVSWLYCSFCNILQLRFFCQTTFSPMRSITDRSSEYEASFFFSTVKTIVGKERKKKENNNNKKQQHA